MLRQNPGNVRAVKVHRALHEQPQADIRTHLQPQLKRRRVSATDTSEQQVPSEHCVSLQKATWKALTSALVTHLKAAADKGFPGASKVTFALPDAEATDHDTAMIASPEAEAAPADTTGAASLVLELDESDEAANREVSHPEKASDMQDGKVKAGGLPIVPQRASRRLGSSR